MINKDGEMINGLDLFSGIGGMSLALREWVRPVAYCEIDTYCQAVLLSNMVDGKLQCAPIWDDIKTLECSFIPPIDIIYGGFPCQDISIAGLGKGLEGERSGLFFEIVRLAKEIKPKFIFLENVPAIRSRGGLRVVSEITHMGYDCRWCVISAASVGALHKRERWFLLAHSRSERLERFGKRAECPESKESKFTSSGKDVANSMHTRRNNAEQKMESKIIEPRDSIEQWKETVSKMGKLSDGISYHNHRLRALGNSVVPVQAKEAFKILMGLK